MNGGELCGLNLLGEPVNQPADNMNDFLPIEFLPEGSQLIVDYRRESPKLPEPVQVTAPKRARHRGRFYPNQGTIVNTAPRLSRNTVVVVGGAPPAKLKRTQLRMHGLPFKILDNRPAPEEKA